MTNWKTLISNALEGRGESWNDVVSHTLSDDEMEKMFDAGYGYPEGAPFTLWTKGRVYFPLVYDGAESVGTVARNPDGKATPHQGRY